MKTLLLNTRLVNEGRITETDVLIDDGFIAQIAPNLSGRSADTIIDAAGQYLLPGVIDDQVHFREPGLTHKATIHSESRAGVAGGVTTFMEMPNTVPNALTQELLADKYAIAARTALGNYSFFMGASNNNLDEVLRTDPATVCGIKVFMGSSTGNMLVDNERVLDELFRQSPMLIATHCEDEATIRANTERYRAAFGRAAFGRAAFGRAEYGAEDSGPRSVGPRSVGPRSVGPRSVGPRSVGPRSVGPRSVPAGIHPLIRNEEACLKSSSMAVELAKKHNTRLHILHISTADELVLFDNTLPLTEKRITAEVCVHHLWFDASDYDRLGNLIKCNPAIKDARHKPQLLAALLDDRLDIIATDHAPHTWAEKHPASGYWSAPSGLPLVQHPLLMMLSFVEQGKLSLETMVRKMCHAPADCFQIDRRGYAREGYWADLVLVDPKQATTVTNESVLYQCGWSPLAGHTFSSAITHTVFRVSWSTKTGVFLPIRPGSGYSLIVIERHLLRCYSEWIHKT